MLSQDRNPMSISYTQYDFVVYSECSFSLVRITHRSVYTCLFIYWRVSWLIRSTTSRLPSYTVAVTNLHLQSSADVTGRALSTRDSTCVSNGCLQRNRAGTGWSTSLCLLLQVAMRKTYIEDITLKRPVSRLL